MVLGIGKLSITHALIELLFMSLIIIFSCMVVINWVRNLSRSDLELIIMELRLISIFLALLG